MSSIAKIELEGKTIDLPVIIGSEGEKAINISRLRSETGHITLDDGYGNTGSCESAITFIDGDKGILRYRGYPIEDLAEHSTFIECAYLLIYGHLPSHAELSRFSNLLTEEELLHEDMKHHFEGFPSTSHPMAILSSMINASSCFYRGLMSGAFQADRFEVQAARLISQVRTIAAFSHRISRGLPIVYPNPAYKYTANFLHMMFSEPYNDFKLDPVVVRALDLIFLLHADHEQNCSTSTVRMVASSKANLFASAAAGVCALWGPLHGGANQAVIEMLEKIHAEGDDGSRFITAAKDKNSGKRLMGFGHRVYKNYDPRAKIMQKTTHEVLKEIGNHNDPLLHVALELEKIALTDPYFIEKKLYPNIDFYSGITLKALGFPTNMFTVLFALARTVGWIAQWTEMIQDPHQKIGRPRQLYTGKPSRDYIEMGKRS